jgi:hypothetical protein
VKYFLIAVVMMVGTAAPAAAAKTKTTKHIWKESIEKCLKSNGINKDICWVSNKFRLKCSKKKLGMKSGVVRKCFIRSDPGR